MKKLLNTLLLVGVFMVCALTAYGQSSSVTNLSVEAASTPLIVTNVDGGVADVVRGKSYRVVFDAYTLFSSIYPTNDGEFITNDVGVDIIGEPSSAIVVEMQLPDVLGGIAGTSMAIHFPSSGPGSGVIGETGGFFNPNIPNTFNLGVGALTLRLGYTFTVPPEVTIAGDSFDGMIFTNAYYTGL